VVAKMVANGGKMVAKWWQMVAKMENITENGGKME
jgi:hypothetical protein